MIFLHFQYTTLPHKLIKDTLLILTDTTFMGKHSLYLARNKNHAFITFVDHKHYSYGTVRTFVSLLSLFELVQQCKLYRQIFGYELCSCPLIADLFVLL